jgi:hypothetical protein
MFMSLRRVPVGFLAMVMGGSGVLLRFVVLTSFVVVSSLMVMMGCSRVASCRLMMMLGRGMFSLVSHSRSPG